MPSILPIATLSAAGRAELAALHVRTMHTLLSDMGLPFVLKYYELAARDPAAIGLCAVEGDDVVGYAVGSPEPHRLLVGVRSPAPWFARQLVRLAATRPGVVVQLAASRLRSARHAVRHGEVELTYIGVAPRARGSGIGRRLLAEFGARAVRAGHATVVLSVETDNAAAISLYRAAGFRTRDTFREGRFVRHRMECPLDAGRA